ncbi:MAG: alpha/beta fold hydrolase [Ilumatobacter sp.]
MSYERFGEGPDVVWGHGLTQSRSLEDRRGLVDWRDVAATVTRYDARGHGESESTDDLDAYHWSALALDQLGLADVLGIERYVAAGASMGCATALHAAVVAPERIRAMVLVIPPTGWETRAAQTDVYEAGAHVVATQGIEPLIRASRLRPPPDPFIDDPAYREVGEAAMRNWDTERLARVMLGAARAQLPDRSAIAAIACPTLVLSWTGDAVHPESSADELTELLPDVEHHVASTATELATWSTRIAHFVARTA